MALCIASGLSRSMSEAVQDQLPKFKTLDILQVSYLDVLLSQHCLLVYKGQLVCLVTGHCTSWRHTLTTAKWLTSSKAVLQLSVCECVLQHYVLHYKEPTVWL